MVLRHATPHRGGGGYKKVEKEKLIDYLLAQNEKLSGQLAGVREEMRLQRERPFHTLISTYRMMKVSVSEYFRKVYAMIVRGCTDPTSMLPMNMGLRVNNC